MKALRMYLTYQRQLKDVRYYHRSARNEVNEQNWTRYAVCVGGKSETSISVF